MADHKEIREYVDKGVYSISFFNRFASEDQIFSVHASDEDKALEIFWFSHPKNKFLLDDDDCSVYEANKQEREWLRQLLDENQNKDAIIEHLRQEVDIHAKELSKAVDENQALTKERDFYKEDRDRCERLERKAHEKIQAQAKQIANEIDFTDKLARQNAQLHERLEAQAKEIERLKELIKRNTDSVALGYERLEEKNAKLQADKEALEQGLEKSRAKSLWGVIDRLRSEKAEVVETLRWYADEANHDWDIDSFGEITHSKVMLDEGERARTTLQKINI